MAANPVKKFNQCQVIIYFMNFETYTLNYDGYVAITEGQAFDLSLKGLCHGSPVHFVEFCQFNTRPQSLWNLK